MLGVGRAAPIPGEQHLAPRCDRRRHPLDDCRDRAGEGRIVDRGLQDLARLREIVDDRRGRRFSHHLVPCSRIRCHLARPGRGVKPNHSADQVPTSRTRAIFMDSPGPIAEIAGSTRSHGIAAIGMLRAGDNATPMRIFQQVNRPIASQTGAPGNRLGDRLRVGGMQLAPEAGAALFPDFTVEARSADTAVPLARLGEGLCRAPPHAGMAAGLSVVALSVSGPPSPADCFNPTRLLRERGWETPELIGRAQAARQALLAARIGGAWWGDELPAGDGDALVVLAEPMVSGNAGPTSEAVLLAMLDAALGRLCRANR